jgi:hypothetical protein
MQTAQCTIELIDWMEWAATPARLIRQVRCVSGRVGIVSEMAMRFNYGRALPWHRRMGERLAVIGGPWALWLDAQTRANRRRRVRAKSGRVECR